MSKPYAKPYKWVKKPTERMCAHTNTFIQEHRLVAEQIVGRQLYPQEVVHHIDGNTLNNNVENLQVFASHSDHTKFHNGIDVYEKDNVWYAIENPIIVCKTCGKPFRLVYKDQTFCSRQCANESMVQTSASLESIQQMLFDAQGNISAVGNALGVSGNAIANRLKRAKLPYHSSDYRMPPINQ